MYSAMYYEIDEEVCDLRILGTAPCGKPETHSDEIHSLDCPKLIDRLCKVPHLSYVVKAIGDSMTGRRIFDGDLVTIDCSVEAEHNKIVLVSINGDLTLKVYHCPNNQTPVFLPANPRYSAVRVTSEDSVQVFGVATSVVFPLF